MPAISPRTQAMGQMGGTSDQAKALFDQGLSQMAYNVLLSKFPNIAQDVVTFKVLDTDHEKGSGVGAFVLMRRGQTLYIPVVMADNQIKPLDILYFKELNTFMPLTKEWLQELDKQALGELGEGVTPPKTMATDVDIRNTVVPPTTGRYSYAAENNAGLVFSEARNQSDTKLAFLDFLQKSPNRVKKAAAKMLETRPALLKQAVWFYGEKPLVDALKVADYGGGIKHTGGALYVADASTSAGDFKEIFGPRSPAAFSGVRLKGYYAKDDRKNLKRALAVQPYLDLQVPKDSGAYKLWKVDGKPVVALVIANPIDIFGDTEGKRIPARNIRFRPTNSAPANKFQGHNSRYRVPGLDGRRDEAHVDHFVGVTEDGDLLNTTELMGTQVALSQLENSKVFNETVGTAVNQGPRKGQRGIFVQKRGASFVATDPMTIDAVSSTDAVKRIDVIGAWGKKTLVIDSKSPVSKLMVPLHSDLVYLPADYVWFPVKQELGNRDFLKTPKDIFRFTIESMLDEGAEKVKVSKYTGESGYLIGNEYAADFVPALRKLASKAHISVEDAEFALKQASENGRYEFWTLSAQQYVKLAQRLSSSEEKIAGVPKGLSEAAVSAERTNPYVHERFMASTLGKLAPKESDPSLAGRLAGEGVVSRQRARKLLGSDKLSAEQIDPAQQMMSQVQPAPQGPSPVDMAVAEQMQSIQAQMTALQQMQQMVQTIQQRAAMIAGGGGAAAAPAAAAAAMGGPLDPSMMGAGAPVQGMDPSTMQMDPAMMQQMQAQQQQEQQQQAPTAMMSSDDGSVDTLMQQINPQFIEQAGNLQDAGAFDAAALASLSQNPSLKDLVAGYLPNLEKALDNLGRVLLTLWMDEVRIKDDIGDEAYIGLEDNLRTTFRGLGDLLLKINRNTLVMGGGTSRKGLQA